MRKEDVFMFIFFERDLWYKYSRLTILHVGIQTWRPSPKLGFLSLLSQGLGEISGWINVKKIDDDMDEMEI